MAMLMYKSLSQLAWQIILSLIICASVLPCYAKTDAPKVLKVGLIVYPPFVEYKRGAYIGIAVDTWERIAASQNWTYEYVPFGEKVRPAIELAKRQKLDVIVGPISTTFKRSKEIDYTRPFFINIVGIAVPNTPFGIWDSFANIAKSILFTLGLVVVTCVLFLYFLWIAERGFLSKQSHADNSVQHIAWSYLISRRFTYLPVTLRGKLIALCGTGLIGFLIATLIASISSSVTIMLAYQHDLFSEPSKISDKPVAAVAGSSHFEMSKRYGAIPIATTDLEKGFSLLANGEVDGVIGDSESLRDYIRKKKIINAHLADLILRYDEFAFIVPFDSSLRITIDQQLMYLQDEGEMRLICEKYIGPNAKYCEL
jgi:polar amino acid transport system substrate-binding protein